MKYLALALAVIPVVSACGSSGENDGGLTLSTSTTSHAASAGSTTTSAGTGGRSTHATTGASTSGSGASGGGGGSGGGDIVAGKPFDTATEQWTFVPFDGAYCANGSTTGIGVNRSTKSQNVMIYFEGGGACWDESTCYVLMSSIYVSSGYGPTEFGVEEAGLGLSLFDRTDAKNPVKDWSFVYVPYCTGDVHAGNKVANYGGVATMHLGFPNYGVYLSRIIGTWPDAPKVLVTGSSAGGFGAAFNWLRTKQALPNSKVYLLDDSGPPLTSPYADAQEPIWRAAWNVDSTIPKACTACKQHLDALLPFQAAAMPSDRGALISYLNDDVIPTFYGIPANDMPAALEKVAMQDIDPSKNTRYYYATGVGHTLFFQADLVDQGGVPLEDWIADLVNDTASWKSVGP